MKNQSLGRLGHGLGNSILDNFGFRVFGCGLSVVHVSFDSGHP